jgi:hypothetical protein
MQTPSQNRIQKMKRQELYVVPVRERVVTRSITSENKRLNMELKDNEAKRMWFFANITKCLDSVVQISRKNLSKEEKLIEKVRIVDEMFYNVKTYIADIVEFSYDLRSRLIPAMINKAEDLIWEIYDRVYNLNDKLYPLYFTKEEKCYLLNVMKQLKITSRYLLLLQGKYN